MPLTSVLCSISDLYCNLLSTGSAIEWRILGQEKDGSLLASWISIPNETFNPRTHIGMYNPLKKTFDVLHTFPCRENVIQASVNHSQTLLVYVLKDVNPENSEAAPPILSDNTNVEVPLQSYYQPFIVEIKSSAAKPPHRLLEMKRCKQVMVQFLWRKQSTFEKGYQDKFLMFIHEECKVVPCMLRT